MPHVQKLCVHSPDGSTFVREMTSWPPSSTRDVISNIGPRQSMHIYLNSNPVKFHPDPT